MLDNISHRCVLLQGFRAAARPKGFAIVPRPQSARASSLVSVDAFADAICATGAYRLTYLWKPSQHTFLLLSVLFPTSLTWEMRYGTLGLCSATSIGAASPSGRRLFRLTRSPTQYAPLAHVGSLPKPGRGYAPLHLRKGHRPLTLFAIELSPFPFSLPRVWLFP